MVGREIKYFDEMLQYIKYLKEIGGLNKFLNNGSEGMCFLASDKRSVYKVISSDLPKVLGYDLEKIIMRQDIDLKYFAFPEELYADINKMLIGYKARYISPDLFDYRRIYEDNNYIFKIDFDLLLRAYFAMLKEMEKLSNQQIKVYDFNHNLIFTGQELVAIDTCGYKRVDENPFSYNKFALDNAIRDKFDWWIMDNLNEEICEEFEQTVPNDNIEVYLKKLKTYVKKRQ